MSKVLEVSLYCALCSATTKQNIPMPDGWDGRYRSVSDEAAFCPAHSSVAKFADSQCPGCVGGWGDCDLFKSFSYSKLMLTDADFKTLESGVCPKRTNGTFSISTSNAGATFEDIDLRDPPVIEAGKVLAKAIREYAEKYHNRSAT